MQDHETHLRSAPKRGPGTKASLEEAVEVEARLQHLVADWDRCDWRRRRHRRPGDQHCLGAIFHAEDDCAGRIGERSA